MIFLLVLLIFSTKMNNTSSSRSYLLFKKYSMYWVSKCWKSTENQEEQLKAFCNTGQVYGCVMCENIPDGSEWRNVLVNNLWQLWPKDQQRHKARRDWWKIHNLSTAVATKVVTVNPSSAQCNVTSHLTKKQQTNKKNKVTTYLFRIGSALHS